MGLKSIIVGTVLVSAIIFSENINAESFLNFAGIKNSVNHRICARRLEKVYEKLGIRIRTQTFPADRALILSNSGEFDGEVQRIDGIEENYPNLIKVPEPIFDLEASAFVKNAEITIDGWDSLKSYRAGISRGIKYLETNTDGMNPIIASSIEQLFYLLEAKRVDVVIISKNYGKEFIENHPRMHIILIEPPIIKVPLYHYLHKKHQAIVPFVMNTIRQLKDEGKLNNTVK